MEWIFKMIQPVIKDCETPEEAESKIIAWGKNQHPRDAFLALIVIWQINADWSGFVNARNTVK